MDTMNTIEIDFDVFKKLTLLRPTESVSHNDVIRKLLGLGQSQSKASVANGTTGPSPEYWVAKGVQFPAGTEFRATYKGQGHIGYIESGALVVNNKPYSSPSAAAKAITGGPVNGWRFWECRLPGKSTWQFIESLRRRANH